MSNFFHTTLLNHTDHEFWNSAVKINPVYMTLNLRCLESSFRIATTICLSRIDDLAIVKEKLNQFQLLECMSQLTHLHLGQAVSLRQKFRVHALLQGANILTLPSIIGLIGFPVTAKINVEKKMMVKNCIVLEGLGNTDRHPMGHTYRKSAIGWLHDIPI